MLPDTVQKFTYVGQIFTPQMLCPNCPCLQSQLKMPPSFDFGTIRHRALFTTWGNESGAKKAGPDRTGLIAAALWGKQCLESRMGQAYDLLGERLK